MRTPDIVDAVTEDNSESIGKEPYKYQQEVDDFVNEIGDLEPMTLDDPVKDEPDPVNDTVTTEAPDPGPKKNVDPIAKKQDVVDAAETQRLKEQGEAFAEEVAPQPGGGGGMGKTPVDVASTGPEPFPERPPTEPPPGRELVKSHSKAPDLYTFKRFWDKAGSVPGTRNVESSSIPGDGGAGSATPPPPPVPPKAPDRKKPRGHSNDWLLHSLIGRMGEKGAQNLGAMGRGLGQVLGAGAKALGNIPAVLDTAGSAQKAVWGDAGGGAARLLGQGLGEMGAAGFGFLGDTAGGMAELVGGAPAQTLQDWADAEELEAMNEQLMARVQRHVRKLEGMGVKIDSPALFHYIKNFVNTAGVQSQAKRKGAV